MIGSSKIDDQTDDLQRLNDLFALGLNNSEIQRIYRTNKGESISRVHISQIRRGLRWNPNLRSFVMKNELEANDTIETLIDGVNIKTTIAQLLVDNQLYHIYLTYIDAILDLDTRTSLSLNKPNTKDLIAFHINKINEISIHTKN
jgi:hypothetical protein